MTYAGEQLLYDCGEPTMTVSVFQSHAICSTCCCVQIATLGLTGRRTIDVIGVETFLRELAPADEPKPRFGGSC